MIQAPKVSVLLPVYNAQSTILSAVDSILQQKFTSLELIVIDDGSTDHTISQLKLIKDSRLHILRLPHGGIARALNFGIKQSRGQYVARMDADDYSLPERIGTQVTYLEKHPDLGLVSCVVEYIGDREANLGYALYVDHINQLLQHKDIYKKRFQDSPFAHPSVMFRKALIGQYGGYNEGSVPEDYELWLRWLCKGVRMNKVPKILYQWHDHKTRLSRTHDNYNKTAFYRVKSKYLVKELLEQSAHMMPEIWIWGTGKSVKQKLQPLLNYNVEIAHYIEVTPPPYSSEATVYYKDIPPPGQVTILSYIGDRKGKLEVQSYLNGLGYEEGINYYMIS